MKFNVLIFLFCSVFDLFAQQISYPTGYFAFPIMPGNRNFLSGGMGDLRAGHFHAGIDIKTQQREGLPVYASAEGYVSKIIVMRSGYGNVVFVKHPAGFTTVYGHLQSFNESIGNYVRKRQYELQTFEIELYPLLNELPVKKLEMLGLSGNSGGSGGPHLHFEIRDSKDNILNPLNFGFSEIQDDVPPVIEGLALNTLSADARINGAFGRRIIPFRYQKGEGYVVDKPIEINGTIGIELLCFDKTTGSQNKNGVSSIEVEIDGKEHWYYNLEMFPNEWSRDINVHVNYEIEKTRGQRWNRLYVIDGNRMTFYKPTTHGGKINLTDDQVHTITLKVWDAFQNLSMLTFRILKSENTTTEGTTKTPRAAPNIHISQQENLLVIKAVSAKKAPPQAWLYFKKRKQELTLAHSHADEAIFLHDLRRGLPDSVQVEGLIKATNLVMMVPAGQRKRYTDGKLSIDFETNSLYDTLYLNIEKYKNGFMMGLPTIPLRDYVTVSYKPDVPLADKAKTHVYLQSGERSKYVGGVWKGDVIEFRTRELGNFILITDNTPPTVRLVTKSKEAVTAKISDQLSDIGTIKAWVNNEWILMNYDFKTGLIWSEKIDTTKAFEGLLRLEISDRAGNQTVVNEEFVEPILIKTKPKMPPKTISKKRKQRK